MSDNDCSVEFGGSPEKEWPTFRKFGDEGIIIRRQVLRNHGCRKVVRTVFSLHQKSSGGPGLGVLLNACQVQFRDLERFQFMTMAKLAADCLHGPASQNFFVATEHDIKSQ